MSKTPTETLVELETLDIYCDEEKVFRFEVGLHTYFKVFFLILLYEILVLSM